MKILSDNLPLIGDGCVIGRGRYVGIGLMTTICPEGF